MGSIMLSVGLRVLVLAVLLVLGWIILFLFLIVLGIPLAVFLYVLVFAPLVWWLTCDSSDGKWFVDPLVRKILRILFVYLVPFLLAVLFAKLFWTWPTSKQDVFESIQDKNPREIVTAKLVSEQNNKQLELSLPSCFFAGGEAVEGGDREMLYFAKPDFGTRFDCPPFDEKYGKSTGFIDPIGSVRMAVNVLPELKGQGSEDVIRGLAAIEPEWSNPVRKDEKNGWQRYEVLRDSKVERIGLFKQAADGGYWFFVYTPESPETRFVRYSKIFYSFNQPEFVASDFLKRQSDRPEVQALFAAIEAGKDPRDQVKLLDDAFRPLDVLKSYLVHSSQVKTETVH